MLGDIHLIVCQQMEYLTFPTAPEKVTNRFHVKSYQCKNLQNYVASMMFLGSINATPECHHPHQNDHV